MALWHGHLGCRMARGSKTRAWYVAFASTAQFTFPKDAETGNQCSRLFAFQVDAWFIVPACSLCQNAP